MKCKCKRATCQQSTANTIGLLMPGRRTGPLQCDATQDQDCRVQPQQRRHGQWLPIGIGHSDKIRRR